MFRPILLEQSVRSSEPLPATIFQDLNALDDSGNSALHLAAANGHISELQVLLERGAEMQENKGGNTPLHWAVENNQTAAVKLILEKRSDVISSPTSS